MSRLVTNNPYRVTLFNDFHMRNISNLTHISTSILDRESVTILKNYVDHISTVIKPRWSV